MRSRKKTEPKAIHRWKWMAGATAATATGVAASQGSLVTINLTNNYISGFGNHLNADLTGDGHPDLTITGSFSSHSPPIWKFTSQTYPFYNIYASVFLNGIIATAFHLADGYGDSGRIGSHYASSYGATGSIPIFFKDLHINNGQPTEGSLEVFADFGEIDLNSFSYNTNTAVTGTAVSRLPDPGSSLALLAMGAGGVLALRRRRAAQQ